MRGHVLFISKEERTADEAWGSLLRFNVNLYIPETFYADLDNPGIAKAFNHERESFKRKWDVNSIADFRKELQKTIEENGEKCYIESLQNDIDELEAFNNGDLSVLNDEELALNKGDLIEWIENIEDSTIRDGEYCKTKIYKVRDGKIYTMKNFKNSFWDGAFNEPDCLLTDKNGNEVESCIYKDINFNDNLFNNVTAIVWEDSDECLQLDYDYSYAHAYDDSDGRLCLRAATHEEMKERWINETKEILKKVIPDNYVRIIGYQKIHSRR